MSRSSLDIVHIRLMKQFPLLTRQEKSVDICAVPKFAKIAQCLPDRATAGHLEFDAGRRFAKRDSEKAAC